MARKSSSRKLDIDPYLAFLTFAGIGLGTWKLEWRTRFTLLWIVAFVWIVLYFAERDLELEYDLTDIAQGLLIGAILGVPFLVFIHDFFTSTAARLYPADSPLTLVLMLVFVAPLVEGLYFRGFIQRERGLLVGMLTYAVANVIYFMPGRTQYMVVVLTLAGGLGLFGLVYGYVHERYGAVASIVCQGIVNVLLLVIPALPLDWLGMN